MIDVRQTRRLTTTLVALTIALVAGCSPRPEKADTVGGPAVTSSSTATSATTPPPVVEARSLTQAEIDAALLTQAEMPPGWTQDTSEDGAADEQDALTGDDEASTYDPPACEEVVEGLSGDRAEREPVARGEASFGTETFQFLAEIIETWEGSLREAALDDLVEALSTCPQYTETAADGTATTMTISALDMPNYGDRTLAVRLAAAPTESGGFDISFTLDVVVVASGNVSVSIVAGGFAPVDPAVLQQVTSTAMQKVNTVV